MPTPFEGAISKFGLPSTGAQPEQFFAPEDDAIARYRQYLNTGSDVLPSAAPPDSGGDLDEADWSAISRTPNPSATLKMIDQLRSQADYQHGVKEIGALDWSNPTKARGELGNIFARRPAAADKLQKFGGGVYKMLGMPEPKAKTPTNTIGDAGAAAIADIMAIKGDDPEGQDRLIEAAKKHAGVMSDSRVASAFERVHNHFLTSGIRSGERNDKAATLKTPSQKQGQAITDAVSEYERAVKNAKRYQDNPELLPVDQKIKANGGVKPVTQDEWSRAHVRAINGPIESAREKLRGIMDLLGPNYRTDRRVATILGDEVADEGAAAPKAPPSKIPSAVSRYFTAPTKEE